LEEGEEREEGEEGGEVKREEGRESLAGLG
jgi:hypothetical protein